MCKPSISPNFDAMEDGDNMPVDLLDEIELFDDDEDDYELDEEQRTIQHDNLVQAIQRQIGDIRQATASDQNEVPAREVPQNPTETENSSDPNTINQPGLPIAENENKEDSDSSDSDSEIDPLERERVLALLAQQTASKPKEEIELIDLTETDDDIVSNVENIQNIEIKAEPEEEDPEKSESSSPLAALENSTHKAEVQNVPVCREEDTTGLEGDCSGSSLDETKKPEVISVDEFLRRRNIIMNASKMGNSLQQSTTEV